MVKPASIENMHAYTPGYSNHHKVATCYEYWILSCSALQVIQY